MLKKLTISVLSLLLTLAGAQASQAETVLEKTARTGVLTLGAHLNLVPYSYINDKNELVGLSIDIAELIRAEVERELGKPIRLEIVEASDVPSAIPKLRSGEIDLACNTAFTWERDRFVDFTISYSVTGIRLLVPQSSSIKSEETLIGKRIAVVPNSVAEKTVKLAQSKAVLVPVATLEEGILALKNKKVDGVAGDGVLLDGQRQALGVADTHLVPDQPYMSYGIACMVPQHNPAFLRSANRAIVRLAENYVRGDKATVALVQQWIGPEGITNVDPEKIKSFMGYILITHEQIPPKP
jgi:polar amino acid transport system substrate-binding protein